MEQWGGAGIVPRYYRTSFKNSAWVGEELKQHVVGFEAFLLQLALSLSLCQLNHGSVAENAVYKGASTANEKILAGRETKNRILPPHKTLAYFGDRDSSMLTA